MFLTQGKKKKQHIFAHMNIWKVRVIYFIFSLSTSLFGDVLHFYFIFCSMKTYFKILTFFLTICVAVEPCSSSLIV